MSMSKTYKYDKEAKESLVEVFYKGEKSVGRAKLHEEDADFENEYTGYAIADCRAQQKAHHKVCVGLRKRLKAAKALVEEIERQIELHQNSIELLKEEELLFIKEKDAFYNSIRSLRDPVKQQQRQKKMNALMGMLQVKQIENEAE